MAFVLLMLKAIRISKKKDILEEEKLNAIKDKYGLPTSFGVAQKYRHFCIDAKRCFKRLFRKLCSFPENSCMHRTCYKMRHDGSCENYTLKSLLGFLGGFFLTYIFFWFFVFQLNFKLSTATIMCSFFGCILTIGLAFSYKVRSVVLLLLPQFFSKRGRQALLAYAFILAITGPAKNTLNNMSILSESLACGQEQLKDAVRQILEVIKKPFYAIRDAIKTVVKKVKEIVKKIKEILMTIKRIIVSILKVIKACFLFLAKIINICNKELGTPFQRCSRVFESAIMDCNAKLGPMFNWMCSITYLVKTVCYIVKIFDYVCMIVDFISNSIIGVVVRKVKAFIRHIKTMFYVRIKFSHSFSFQTNRSKTMNEIAEGIVTEVKHRAEEVVAIFDVMTCATSLFFMFIIFKVVHYRYKFLTSERFDNRFITKDFRSIDLKRAQLEKETVLPLNHREQKLYVPTDSLKLVKVEKRNLSKSIMVLGTATIKLCTHMMTDYALYWVLKMIRYHARFQSTVQAPKVAGLHIVGSGMLASLLKCIVKAFQPLGIKLEIDTVPCLPDPIPPDYDRYVQIASLVALCWLLTIAEPYGLRLRHSVMCYYHPTRARQRAIWLYNHILRNRSSFLKFARRQLRRKVMGDTKITKVTLREFLKAKFKNPICLWILGPDRQDACMLCGEVFREFDKIKPVRCQNPGCPGIYCEQCFSDLQNLCTVCLSPVQYGDWSDISEEKDSSEEEPPGRKKKKRSRLCKLFKRKKGDEDADSDDDGKGRGSDKKKLLPKKSRKHSEFESKTEDSDYSTDHSTSTQYSCSYQDNKNICAYQSPGDYPIPFRDVEKQHIPDYASMESFRRDYETPSSASGSPKRKSKTPQLPEVNTILEERKSSRGSRMSSRTSAHLQELKLKFSRKSVVARMLRRQKRSRRRSSSTSSLLSGPRSGVSSPVNYMAQVEAPFTTKGQRSFEDVITLHDYSKDPEPQKILETVNVGTSTQKPLSDSATASETESTFIESFPTSRRSKVDVGLEIPKGQALSSSRPASSRGAPLPSKLIDEDNLEVSKKPRLEHKGVITNLPNSVGVDLRISEGAEHEKDAGSSKWQSNQDYSRLAPVKEDVSLESDSSITDYSEQEEDATSEVIWADIPSSSVEGREGFTPTSVHFAKTPDILPSQPKVKIPKLNLEFLKRKSHYPGNKYDYIKFETIDETPRTGESRYTTSSVSSSIPSTYRTSLTTSDGSASTREVEEALELPLQHRTFSLRRRRKKKGEDYRLSGGSSSDGDYFDDFSIDEGSHRYKRKIRDYYKTVAVQTSLIDNPKQIKGQHKIIKIINRVFRKAITHLSNESSKFDINSTFDLFAVAQKNFTFPKEEFKKFRKSAPGDTRLTGRCQKLTIPMGGVGSRRKEDKNDTATSSSDEEEEEEEIYYDTTDSEISELKVIKRRTKGKRLSDPKASSKGLPQQLSIKPSLSDSRLVYSKELTPIQSSHLEDVLKTKRSSSEEKQPSKSRITGIKSAGSRITTTPAGSKDHVFSCEEDSNIIISPSTKQRIKTLPKIIIESPSSPKNSKSITSYRGRSLQVLGSKVLPTASAEKYPSSVTKSPSKFSSRPSQVPRTPNPSPLATPRSSLSEPPRLPQSRTSQLVHRSRSEVQSRRQFEEDLPKRSSQLKVDEAPALCKPSQTEGENQQQESSSGVKSQKSSLYQPPIPKLSLQEIKRISEKILQSALSAQEERQRASQTVRSSQTEPPSKPTPQLEAHSQTLSNLHISEATQTASSIRRDSAKSSPRSSESTPRSKVIGVPPAESVSVKHILEKEREESSFPSTYNLLKEGPYRESRFSAKKTSFKLEPIQEKSEHSSSQPMNTDSYPSTSEDSNCRFSREPAERDSDSRSRALGMSEDYGGNETCGKDNAGKWNRRNSYDYDKQTKDETRNVRGKSCEDYNRYRSDSRDRGSSISKTCYPKDFAKDNYQQSYGRVGGIGYEPLQYGNQVEGSRSNEDFRSTYGARLNEDKRSRKGHSPSYNQYGRGRPHAPSPSEAVSRKRSETYRFPNSSSYVCSDPRCMVNEGYGSRGDHLRARGPVGDDSSDNEYNESGRTCKCCDQGNKQAYRRCNCCECDLDYDPCRGDEDCNCSLAYNDNVEFAYQHGGKYPELVDELEESITQRNKERFQRSMRRFEMLSRGNFDRSFLEEEDECACTKHQASQGRDHQYYHQRPPRNLSGDRYRNIQGKTEYMPKRSSFKTTPFSRCAGYVEKVVKYMDPSTTSEPTQKYNKPTSKARWELDQRSGEWYKVCERNYDFETSFPPLPPAPAGGTKEGCPCDRNSMKMQGSRDYPSGSQRMSQKYMGNSTSKACMCACCCKEKRF